MKIFLVGLMTDLVKSYGQILLREKVRRFCDSLLFFSTFNFQFKFKLVITSLS